MVLRMHYGTMPRASPPIFLSYEQCIALRMRYGAPGTDGRHGAIKEARGYNGGAAREDERGHRCLQAPPPPPPPANCCACPAKS
eukprot:2280151-Rhodomonas_salina.1